MSQAAFNGLFNFDSNNGPRKTGKKKLQRRQRVMDRAVEALEERRLLSVSGFQPAVNYTAAAGARAVASGDFNHDGKDDLVVANQTANSVSVLLGNGNGTFATAVNSAAGSGPRAVVVGDFNGDGKLDVAVADQTSGVVSVLLGNGDGTFNTPVTYTVGSAPVAIISGDFNGDGKIDLAVADFGDVRVLLGNGDGTFANAVTYTAGTSPNGLAVADFNHDGKLDLAVSNGGGNVSVLTGNGDGTFNTAANFAAGANIKGLAAADFNGDGYADLAVVNGTAGTISILTNNGSGSFGSPSTFNVGTSPIAITAADFNSDGNMDLAVVNNGGNNVSVLSGVGDGTFGAAVNKTVGTTPTGVVADDFNADGSTDLAVANNGGNNVSVLLDKHITATGQAQVTLAGTALNSATVATFTDSEAGTVDGDYTATIDWGDGSAPTAGTITSSNGVFSVAGSNNYQEQGVYDVTVTIQDTLGTTAVATTTAEVDDAPITAAGTTVTATEGASWSGTVGSFTDGNTFSTAGDFLVAIDWGDGTSGTGTVVDDGGGAFHVTASHTWEHNSSPTITMDVQDVGGQESVATTAVTVDDAAINGSAGTPVFTEGSSATQTVATFTDDNPFGSAGEFSAVIDWGDNTQSNATITVIDGGYEVSGAHSYAHAGDKSMSVTITSTGGSTSTVTPTATVDNADMEATGQDVTVTEGTGTGSIVVASFTDANASASATDFGASIDWGDSSSADVGTIAWNAGTQQFDVTAPDHTYDHAGDKTITVTVTGAGNGTATAAPTATVNDAAIAVTAQTVSATEGTSTGSILLGTFTDANAAADVSDFSASVNWGDGMSADTDTTITWNNIDQDFEVTGSHTYAHAGAATMTLTVTGAGGSTHSDHTDNTVANDTIEVTANEVDAVEGSSFSGKVASFQDVSPLAQGSDYEGDFTASIDWGDNVTTGGLVTWNPDEGAFDITGTHTYVLDGSQSVTVTVTGLANGSGNDTNTAVIADAALHSTGVDVTGAVEGTTTGSVLLATFTDEDPGTAANHYNASVDWGDGDNNDTNVSVVANGDHFEVWGEHTYDHAGDQTIAVTIGDDGDSTTLTSATATVANADVTPTQGSLSATEGQSASGVLATFVDANGAATADDFSASIDWGDGSDATSGVVAWDAGNSDFTVTGSHTYDHAGDKTVTITIDGAYGPVAQTSITATVINDTLTVNTNAITGAQEGIAIDPMMIAHFTDANSAASADDFTATVHWGDNQTTNNAQIVANDDGGFDVVAGHTFDHAGPTTVQVVINGNGGGSQSDSQSSTILNQTITATGDDFTVVEGDPTGSVVVAGFTDPNAAAVASDFSATVDWGDSSSPDNATIAWNADTNQFDVTAPTHTYDHAGTQNLTVTINGLGNGSATATPNASVANAAISVTAQTISATEGTGTGTVTVATFTDANAAASAGDFTANINWGDGNTTSNATVQVDNNGGFDVLGGHTYTDAGSYNVTVTVNGNGGGSESDSATASVANQTITATGTTFSATEGSAFTGKLIGTFTDDNTLATAGAFTVTIDWGDSSALDTTTGVITSNGNGFNVVGDHNYAHSGPYTVTFTVTGAANGTGLDTSTANVGDAALSSTGTTVNAIEGTTATGLVVAHFADANPNGVLGSYTATITWGDGGATSAGTITSDGQGGWNVTGSHLYTTADTYDVSVLIGDSGTSTTTASSTATVSHGTINATGNDVTATEGTALAGTTVVANFTDTNLSVTANGLAATIDWGDNSSSIGTVVSDGNGGFNVEGGHTWMLASSLSVTITINDIYNDTASVSSMAIVGDAALSSTGVNISAIEGQTLSGVQVMHFTDANPFSVAGDFTVSINWGDGTSSAGTVQAADGGGYDVFGTHTYAHAGNKTLLVVVGDAGGSTTSAGPTATIANATLGITADSLGGTEGTPIVANVATFTDANVSASATDFSATIDWGDGNISVGAINDNGEGGFDVLGGHTYHHAGTKTITVTINGNGGGTTSTTITAAIANAALSASGLTAVATEGTDSGSITLAHFTDANANAVAADFGATVVWGDGSNDTASVVAHNGGGFDVVANHTYVHSGDEAPVVTITGAGGGTAQATATVHVDNATLDGTGSTVNAVEGQAIDPTTVLAHFTDSNTGASANDFTTTITWGDGSSVAAATIVANDNGGFDVLGGHTYAHAGNATITVDISGNGGGTTTATSSVAIANDTLTATGKSATAVEGSSSATLVLAHFTDANTSAVAGDFAASIDWGDGNTTDGTVIANNSGGFDVTGSHLYAHAGDQTAVVTITGNGNGQASADAAVHIDNAALHVTGETLSTTEGGSFSGEVATFTDANASASTGDFGATIDWGDGTQSIGSISAADGVFSVTGSHTYSHESSRTVTISVTGAGGGTAQGTSAMTVADAEFSVAAASGLTAVEGTSMSNVTVGTLTDTNTLGSAANFVVRIDWGDGTALGTGSLVQTSAGVYAIKASHTFAHAGSKAMTVSVTGDGGAVQTDNANVAVGNATMTATGVTTLKVTAGKSFTGKVAHFTDANAPASAADFTAAINWADGTSSAGVITVSNTGGFDVAGTHAWRSGGTKAMSITVTGAGGGTANANSTATVAIVPVTMTGATLRAVRGVSVTANVASLATTNTLAQPGDFTATIAWGDGTTSAGTIVAKNGGGFSVVGTHTYAATGTYSAKITTYTADGQRLVAGSTLTVTKPAASGGHTVGGGHVSTPVGHHTHHQRHLMHVHHVSHETVAARHKNG